MSYSQPLISVIVPVYNAEKTIDRCIQSILMQDYCSFELILVNDGSKDHSLAICENYKLMDKRVKVITQPNRGVSVARNAGLQIAKGEWVSFIDSDDYVQEGFFEGVENAQEDLLVRGYHCFDLNGDEMSGESLDKVFPQPSLTDFIKSYVHNLVLRGPMMKFYRYDKLLNLQFDEQMKIGEDSNFVLQYLARCNSYKILYGNYYIFISDNNVNPKKYFVSVDYAVTSLHKIFMSYRELDNLFHIGSNGFLSYFSYFKYISKDDWKSNKAQWFLDERILEMYDYLSKSMSLKNRCCYLVSKLLVKSNLIECLKYRS